LPTFTISASLLEPQALAGAILSGDLPSFGFSRVRVFSFVPRGTIAHGVGLGQSDQTFALKARLKPCNEPPQKALS